MTGRVRLPASGLKSIISSGEWKSDRASPTSQVGGHESRRRYCKVDGTVYYARLVKNPAGKFALFQGKIESASEWEAPGSELPPVKEEANEVKEVRPPAHHCRSLLTQAHCSLCPQMPAQPAAAHILHSSQCMLSSHVCPSFSHCYLPLPPGEEEEDKQGGRRGKGRGQAGGTEGRGQEAAPPEQGRRQEGRRQEGRSHCCAPDPGWGWQPS